MAILACRNKTINTCDILLGKTILNIFYIYVKTQNILGIICI